MDLQSYEKEADNPQYIYFKRYYGREEYMEAHFHESIEIVFVVKGQVWVCINAQEKILSSGEIAFANSFDTHLYKPSEDAIYYVVLISTNYLDSGINLKKYTFPTYLDGDAEFTKIEQFLEFSESIWKGANQIIKKGFVDMLMGMLKKAYHMEQAKDKKTSVIMVALIKYINEHFCEEITLAFLANKFGYTKNYISELFNAFTKMNLREYVNRCRIREYYKLKKAQPELPEYKLAELCGFGNANTFYRALHRYAANKPKF